jgi:hypothetical protein
MGCVGEAVSGTSTFDIFYFRRFFFRRFLLQTKDTPL